MAFSIKDPEADRLVRELASRTGESLTESVVVAVRERLRRLDAARRPQLRDDIARIARRCSALPIVDDRPADDVLGYDELGMPR